MEGLPVRTAASFYVRLDARALRRSLDPDGIRWRSARLEPGREHATAHAAGVQVEEPVGRSRGELHARLDLLGADDLERSLVVQPQPQPVLSGRQLQAVVEPGPLRAVVGLDSVDADDLDLVADPGVGGWFD